MWTFFCKLRIISLIMIGTRKCHKLEPIVVENPCMRQDPLVVPFLSFANAASQTGQAQANRFPYKEGPLLIFTNAIKNGKLNRSSSRAEYA